MKISTNCVRKVEKATGIKTLIYKRSTVNDYLFNRYSKQVQKFVVFFDNFIKEKRKEAVFKCNFTTGELSGVAMIPDISNGIAQKASISFAQWEVLLLYIEKMYTNTDYEFTFEKTFYTVKICKRGLASYGFEKTHTSGVIK